MLPICACAFLPVQRTFTVHRCGFNKKQYNQYNWNRFEQVSLALRELQRRKCIEGWDKGKD